MATSVEVYWPDGRSVVRMLEPSDLNSMLEIQYPQDVEVTPTAQVQVPGQLPEASLMRISLKKYNNVE